MTVFARRLLFVVGKGGVGRTTVAISLAIAAAQRGQRVGVLELYANDQVARRFSLGERSYAPRPIAPGVKTQSLTPLECLDDFGKQKLRVGALVRVLFHNRVFRAFVDAVPGLHDVFQLGKINALATDPAPEDPQYDLIIIDAPATGHGLTLLQAAGSMGEMVGRGLVAEESVAIEELLHDPKRTGLVLVTLPDELPVNESMELLQGLDDRREQVVATVVNQVRDLSTPDAPPWDEVAAALDSAGATALRQAGEELLALQARQNDALAKLDEELPRILGRPCPVLHQRRIEPHELSAKDLPDLAEQLLEGLDAWGAA